MRVNIAIESARLIAKFCRANGSRGALAILKFHRRVAPVVAHPRAAQSATMGDTVDSLKDRANALFKGKRATADLFLSHRNVALPTVLNSPAEHRLIRTPCQPFATQSTSTPKLWSCTAKL